VLVLALALVVTPAATLVVTPADRPSLNNSGGVGGCGASG